MKQLVLVGVLVTVCALLLLAQSQPPVTLSGGQSVTVACTATPSTCPPAAPVPSGHEDHFARHPVNASVNGRLCTTCHGARSSLTGGTAVYHGDRVFPTFTGRFTGPAACYTAPWGAPGFPATDPLGTEVFPAQVCAPNTANPRLAIFNNGTPVVCAHCHQGNFDD